MTFTKDWLGETYPGLSRSRQNSNKLYRRKDNKKIKNLKFDDALESVNVMNYRKKVSIE